MYVCMYLCMNVLINNELMNILTGMYERVSDTISAACMYCIDRNGPVW